MKALNETLFTNICDCDFGFVCFPNLNIIKNKNLKKVNIKKIT